jgi:RimJ/RimL family protein N-acetyltransferase
LSRISDLWPLFGLRVKTPLIEIRLPGDDDLGDLIDEVLAGIHDSATMPFTNAWTDIPSPRRERESLQWWWQQRAGWNADRWCYTGAVFRQGKAIGVQDLRAEKFSILRSVETGSWLGTRHQGLGLGTEARAAILHLAFAGLGAEEAHSLAWHDNERSIRVSSSLGYVVNGESIKLRRELPDVARSFRLTRGTWERSHRDDIEIEGLDDCLEMFGVG